MRSKLLLALLFVCISANVMAGKNEDYQIKVRQSAYTYIGWNAAKLKDYLVDHPETFDKNQVINAAQAIAAVANSGLGALYGPGTDDGTGWKKTRLKPEFFDKPDEAKKVAVTFNQEANELARIAATGDIEAIKPQFAKLSQSCKACHDSFRIRELN